jgi:hypothetical protein
MTDTHRTVAQAGYAPILSGVSKVEGALTAYIMEHLPHRWLADSVRLCKATSRRQVTHEETGGQAA